jgi:acetyl esterase/lipase
MMTKLVFGIQGRVCLLTGWLLMLAATAQAEPGPETMQLWPQGAPGVSAAANEEKELPLRPGDTTIRVTNVSRPTLTVFRPAAEKNTGTAVLICPGGGYGILAYNKEGTEVAQWLNSIGVTGVLLKYRVPQAKGPEKHAAPLQDAQRALGLVRERAKDWGIAADRVGVLGFSAGGHLAATLSNNFQKRSYEPIDAADQQSCRPDFALLIYPAYLAIKDQGDALAPEVRVTAETPRTFLVQTQDDSVRVECSLSYYLALKNAKVPSEMHIYPSGGHGYGLRESEFAVSTWPERAEQWLRSLGLLTPAK